MPTSTLTGCVVFLNCTDPSGSIDMPPTISAILDAVPNARAREGSASGVAPFARLVQTTRSFTSCRRDLAVPASWRASSCVGARTSPRGLYRRTGPVGGEFSASAPSASLMPWRSGSRYAMDLPDPVSDARRNCFHPSGAPPSAGGTQCAMLRLWMGVGVALGPSSSLRDATKPGRSGGEVKLPAASAAGLDTDFGVEAVETGSSGWKNSSACSGFS